MNYLKDKKNIFKIILLLIFLSGIFLRFYRFPERLSMDADSGRDAVVAWYGAKNFQLPLVGPFISIAPVTTGPWYWWQIIAATIIIPSKLAPWIYLGLISSVLILINYKIGVLLENKLLGLFLALITALAPQQIVSAHWLTNPSIIGFFSSLVVLYFLKIAKEKQKPINGLLFGLFLGIAVNAHYQAAGLVSLLFFLLLLDKGKRKIFLVASLIFLSTFIPTLFFELTNHWFDTRNLIEYLLVGQYKFWTSMRWLAYFFDFWPKLWTAVIGGNQGFSLFFILATIIFIAHRFYKRVLSKELLFLGLSFFIQVVIIRYYRGERYFGYLQFFHPFIFIFTGYILYTLWNLRPKPWVGFLTLAAYLIIILPTVKSDIFQKHWVEIISESNKKIGLIIEQTHGVKYTLYRCESYDADYGRGLFLLSNIQNRLGENSKYRFGYYNGHCSYPETFETEIARLRKETINYEKIFPVANELIDLSGATPAAILKAKWIPLTAEEEYKSAARWWFAEQP